MQIAHPYVRCESLCRASMSVIPVEQLWRPSRIVEAAKPSNRGALLQCMSPVVAVRPEGADHQWRKNPPGELSIDPVADERLMRVTAWVGAS